MTKGIYFYLLYTISLGTGAYICENFFFKYLWRGASFCSSCELFQQLGARLFLFFSTTDRPMICFGRPHIDEYAQGADKTPFHWRQTPSFKYSCAERWPKRLWDCHLHPGDGLCGPYGLDTPKVIRKVHVSSPSAFEHCANTTWVYFCEPV